MQWSMECEVEGMLSWHVAEIPNMLIFAILNAVHSLYHICMAKYVSIYICKWRQLTLSDRRTRMSFIRQEKKRNHNLSSAKCVDVFNLIEKYLRWLRQASAVGCVVHFYMCPRSIFLVIFLWQDNLLNRPTVYHFANMTATPSEWAMIICMCLKTRLTALSFTFWCTLRWKKKADEVINWKWIYNPGISQA